jgi:hypothetical protein
MDNIRELARLAVDWETNNNESIDLPDNEEYNQIREAVADSQLSYNFD